MTWILHLLCETVTPEWLTAIGTTFATLLALALALWGPWFRQWFYHPTLEMTVKVQHPDANLSRRWFNGADRGETYYFRAAITNTGNTAARDVQLFLAKVEQVTESGIQPVDRFSPMNLIWTHSGDLPAKDKITRPVLLPDMPPVYCDMVHVGEPSKRWLNGEDLENVPPDKAVLGLDVQVPTSSKGHLLEPGTYLFSLTLAGSNCTSRHHILRISFSGDWLPEKEMFETGFKMEKLPNVIRTAWKESVMLKLAQIISALATAVLAVLTIFLVHSNNQYVALTNKLVLQQQDPEVELGLSFPGLPSELLIHNSGPQQIDEVEVSYDASLQTNAGPMTMFSMTPSPAMPHAWWEIPTLAAGREQSKRLADIIGSIGQNVDLMKSSPGSKNAGIRFAVAVNVVFLLQYRRDVDRKLYKSHLDAALLKDSNTGKYVLEDQRLVVPLALSPPDTEHR